MRRGFLVAVGGILVVITLLVLAPLLMLVRSAGPFRNNVTLPGGVPATFYYPDGEYDDPPAAVVGHGYSGDRATMSSLARRLSRAGYAVLAIDFRGHGANPNAFGEGDRADDVVAALDWLETEADLVPRSLALLGHSMGGDAVLEVAREDERVDATVVLGASGSTAGARNVLFLYGGNEAAPPGAERIEGANHITILWFDETFARTVGWLDEALGVERDGIPDAEDPRLRHAFRYFVSAVLALPFLGLIAGRIVRRSPYEPPPAIRGFALVAIALAVAVPIGSLVDPARFLGAGYGDVVSVLAVAGVVLCLVQLRRKQRIARPSVDRAYRVGIAALLAVAGAFVLFVPLDGVVHRLVPTYPRLVLACLMAPVLAVFFVPFQALLRRGPVWRATATSVAGHALVLVALGAGVVLGLFPGVVALALPLLAGVFGLIEAFGLGSYARSRSGAFVGIVEALWVAGIVAVAMPLPW